MIAPIYLDYAATTPVAPEVAHAMSEALIAAPEYGNSGSVTHVFGRRAGARIESARAQVAALIGASPDEIIFTSGATESNNLAILGVARANADRGRHIITSRIEHKAILDPCKQLEREGFTVTYLAPDANGVIAPESVRGALRPDTTLVSIMHANNEIGVVQDIRAIAEVCREHGIPVHTDAAQSVGKIPAGRLEVDFLSFTAHKLYGPQGISALYVRKDMRPQLRAIAFGGGQERGLRPGTLPLHQIIGFGVACELAMRALATEPARIARLRDRLWKALQRLDGVHLNGESAPRLAEILNVSFEGVEGESLVTALPMLALTTGSACNSASGEPSYVLRALGRSTQLAQSSLRFSLGRTTTEIDIDRAAAAVIRQVERLRSVSPARTSVAGAAHSPHASVLTQQVAAVTVHSSALAAECAHSSAQDRVSAAPHADAARPDFASPSVFEDDTLSPLARHYFDALPGAGALTSEDNGGASSKGTVVRGEGAPSDGKVVRGEAGSSAEGTWVRFHLRVADGTVKAALFQAYGCPHTLAVSAWLAGQLPGRRREDLVPGTPTAWLQAMAAPVEKLGRMLTVEDALKATLQHWDRAP
jgi:cysteine desulfurase